MLSTNEKPIINRKHCLIILLGLGLTIAGAKTFAQTPPPPPPPPGEVFNRINPFKKNKKGKDTVKKVDTAKGKQGKSTRAETTAKPIKAVPEKEKRHD